MPPIPGKRVATRHGARVSLILAVISLGFLAIYWFNFTSNARTFEEQALRRMEVRAGALTEAVAEQTRGSLYNIDLALQHLAHVYSTHQALTAVDVVAVEASTPPGLVRRITLIGADGVVTATFPEGGTGVNLRDRPHFTAHLDPARASNSMYIDQPIASRIEDKWVIPVSRPLLDAGGQFDGVIAIMINPEYFAELYGRLALSHDDVVALVLRDGAFLSRSLNLEQHLGKSVRGNRPFLDPDAPDAGAFHSLSSHEPLARVFAYRRLQEWPVVTVIGLSVDSVLGPLRAALRRDAQLAGAVTTLVIVLLAGISMALLRLDRSLVRVQESDDRRAMASAGADELAWEWNVAAGRVSFFGNCMPFFGIPAHEHTITGLAWIRRFHPDDRQLIIAETRGYVASGGERLDYRYRLRVAPDTYRWVLVRGQTVALDRHGRVQKALGIVLDVDTQRKTELRAAQLKETYERLIESASEAIIAVDAAGRIELFNPAACRLFGYADEEIRGRQPEDVLMQREAGRKGASPARCPIMETVLDGRPRRGVRLNYRHKAGHAIPVELSVAPLRVEDEPLGAVALLVDVSRHLAYEAELERLARTDGLTGLWNRRYFVEQCLHEMRRAERMSEPLCLMMLDLDHFKQINDRHGHAAGDAVLVAFAHLLKASLREMDIPGRLGGEEFCIGLPGITLEEAFAVANRLRQSIEAMEIPFEGHAIRITASVGLGKWDGRESLDALLGRVDACLYRAKDSGRNTVCHV